jgi:hypothetical protein
VSNFAHKSVRQRTLSKKKQFGMWASLYYLGVKSRELTPKQILSVPCPTCGAAMKEVCELNTGAPRTEAHRDRKLNAAEAVEAKRAKR